MVVVFLEYLASVRAGLCGESYSVLFSALSLLYKRYTGCFHWSLVCFLVVGYSLLVIAVSRGASFDHKVCIWLSTGFGHSTWLGV